MRYNIIPKELNDNDYEIFIDEWIINFSKNLKDAWPDIEKTKSVLELRIIQALNASLSVMEIYDYFSISYPGIMHRANENEDEQERIYNAFEVVMKSIVDEMEYLGNK